jgi:hypothetical protein
MPDVEPERLEFTGLEGHLFALADISWSTWGGDRATGDATLQTVKCDPECAYGEEFEDKGKVEVVLRKLDFKCGGPLYRKLLVFHAGEGQYFPINCPTIPYDEAARARKVPALLKRDFGVSGQCVPTGLTRTYECYADIPKIGRTKLGVVVARPGESVTITSCEPTAKLKPNEGASCALRRMRG